MSYKTVDGEPCDGNGRITPNIGDLLDQAHARKARLSAAEKWHVECSRCHRMKLAVGRMDATAIQTFTCQQCSDELKG